MTTFDDRKDAFENKFAHDQDLRFKAISRRNRLLGQWAAGELGRTGDAAAAYATAVVDAGFEAAADDAVARKVAADLAAKGVTEPQVRARMAELLDVAVAQISAGT